MAPVANPRGRDLFDRLVAPASMVVVGVSPAATNLGKEIIRNSFAFGYKGEIFAVGPKGGETLGIKIYRSLSDLPQVPRFAAILVPAEHVPGIIEECGKLGISAALISSGGFSEYEQDRGKLEAELLSAARRHQLRFLGPNCIGVVNMENGLCMPFAPLQFTNPLKGHVGIVAQSGGVGIRCMDLMSEEYLGFSKMISVGNKLDVDESDCIEALSSDPDTHVICAYLEGITRGRRFLQVVAESAKPIIALKANKSPISNIIARSHTAALSSDDRVVDEALKQAGIIRVGDLRDFVPCAKAFELPPLRGKRLVVMSMSGGLSVIGADACAEFGFELPPLPESLTSTLEKRRRGGVIHLRNPLDFGDIYDPSAFAFAVEEVLKLTYIDGVVLSLPRLDGFAGTEGRKSSTSAELTRYFKEVMERAQKPVAVSFFSGRRAIESLLASRQIPLFLGMRESIWALSVQRSFWQRKDRKREYPWDIDCGRSGSSTKSDGGAQLPTDAALDLLETAGIPVARSMVATTVTQAERAADILGFPLAMKTAVEKIVHKTDLGALALDLRSAREVRQSFLRLEKICSCRGLPVRILLQSMAESGIEVIVGGKRDQTFGPIVLFGLGGIWVEALEDIALRVAPVGLTEARGMVDGIKGSKLLYGFRGAKGTHINSICDAIVVVSRLMAKRPDVTELEINPLIVCDSGALAVDARVRLLAPS